MFHRYLLEVSVDGSTWKTAVDKRDNDQDEPHDYVAFEAPFQARYVRITNEHMPAGGKFAISGLRVFGRGAGEPPAPVTALSAQKASDDPMTASINWSPAEAAMGYTVHWGTAPNKLYNCWLLYGRTDLELRALNQGVDYWVRVDAFNENGVSQGETQAVQDG